MNRKSGDFRNSNIKGRKKTNNNNNNNNDEIENENEKGIANRIFTLFPETFARFQNINLDIATVLKEVCLNAALNFSQLNLDDNKTDLKKIDSELKIFVEKSFDFKTKKGDIPTFKTMDQNISGRLRDLAGRQARKDAESRSTRHGENGGGRPRPPLQTSTTKRPSATLAHAAGPSTTSANVAGPSTSFCNVAGPSTSSANVGGGPSTSLFNVAGPSTSFCNVGTVNSAPRTTTQKSKRYLCPKIFGCNKRYNRNGDMLLHLNNSHCNHPEFSKWGIQCTHPKCSYRCESAMSLKSHSPVHDRQCKKVQPGRPTSDPLSLSGPNKQYFCKYCNLSYCRTSDLIRHVNKIHPKEAKKDQPKLVCKTCGRVLLDQKSLQKHRAIVHGSTKKGQKRVNDNDDVNNTMPPKKKLRFSQDVEITDDDAETTSSTNSDTTTDENTSANFSDDKDKGAYLETENNEQDNDSSAEEEEEEDEQEDRAEENEQVSSTVTLEKSKNGSKTLKSILSQNNDADDSDEDEDEDYDKTLSIFPNPSPSPLLPRQVQNFGRFLNSPKIILIDLTSDGSSGSENEIVDETVAKVFNQEIKKSSLDRLDGIRYLNEDLIDAYLNILASKKDGVVAVSTRFYPKVKNTIFDALRRAENTNLFSFSTILVPIHKGGAHWCLAVVEMNVNKIFYFDSLRRPNEECVDNLESFFFSLRGIQHVEKINDQDMPMQINEYDCGVYVCKYAQVYVQNLSIKFTPEDITKFRQEIKNDILFHGCIPID